VDLEAIAPGPADLLTVAFQAFWKIVMIDIAHVALVDPHSKRDGRHHNPARRAQPPFLHGCTVVGIHSRVVGAGFDSLLGEAGGDTLGGLLQGDVDDPGTGRAAGDALDQQRIPTLHGDRGD